MATSLSVPSSSALRFRSCARASGFIGGFTYNGHPTCCAVALANLEIIEAEGLLASARETGSYLLAQLSELLEFDVVGDVRGFGMMLGVELVNDKAGKEPNLPLAEQLNDRFTDETGVIVRSVANHLIFSPPLVFTRDECDQVADATRAMIAKYGG